MIPPNDHRHEQREQREPHDTPGNGDTSTDDDLSQEFSQEFSPITERLAADGASWQAVLPSGVWLAHLARLLPGEPLHDDMLERATHDPLALTEDERPTQVRPGVRRRPGRAGVYNLKRLRREQDDQDDQ